MLSTIIQKELKDIITSPKFVLTFAVCSILILLTFYVGAQNYKVNQSRYEAAVQENLRGMEGVEDWRMIDHSIYLPPEPVASLVYGLSYDIGRNIEVKGRGELLAKSSRYEEDPIYAVFRFLDLDFLFQIILSLIAILFAYNAVNGEKEGGTLRLIFSNSVPRDKFILGKLLGYFSAIIIPLILSFLIGILVWLILGIPMSEGDWAKLSLIILSGFLYFGVFIALAILISTITKRSAHSFLILLVVWIFAVLIIPRASVLIAGDAVEVPSLDEIMSKKAQYSKQLSETVMRRMSEFKPENQENMMQEFNEHMEKVNGEREEKMNAFAEKLNSERENKQRDQQNLALNIARLSPSTSFSLAASNLAGTSLKMQRNFLDQADEYQNVYANFQKEKTGGTTGGGFTFVIRKDGAEKSEIDPTELPNFEYQPISFASVFQSSLIDLGILILYNIIFFAASFVFFLRYDLR